MKKIISFFRKFLSHSVAKNSLIVLTGSMAANFFAYLYHLVVGRVLGPEKYGELAALLSLIYLLNVPAQGIQTVLTKYFSGLKARQRVGETKSLFWFATRWAIVIEILGFVILLLLLNELAAFLHIAEKMNFVWLYLIFSAYLTSIVQLSALQGYQLFLAANIMTNIGSFLRLAFGIFGAFYGVGATLMANIFSNFIMYIVSFIPLGFILKTQSKPVSISRKHALGYSIPAILTTFGLTALYSQDVLLVKHFFLPQTAGIYSSLSVLGKVIFYASSALSFVLFPVVAERSELKKGHRKIVYAGLIAIGAISSVLTMFYFLFPRIIVDLLFGKAFYGATPYLGYFGLFIAFFSLSSLLFSVSLASGKTTVWVIALLGAFAQAMLILLYHQTLFSVITINLAVSISLFIILLLYYTYAKDARA